MKSFLFLFATLCTHSLFSQTLDDIPKATLSKFTEYMKQKKACKLASIPVPDKKHTFTQSQWNANTVVICIADITSDEGTVNEAKGCGFFYYDMARPKGRNYDTMNLLNLKLSVSDSTIKNKECTPETLRQLSNKSIGMGMNGDDFIFGNVDMIASMMNGEHVLFYWENNELKNTYESLKKDKLSKIEEESRKAALDEKKNKEELDLQQKKELEAKKAREEKAAQELKIKEEKSKKLDSMFD